MTLSRLPVRLLLALVGGLCLWLAFPDHDLGYLGCPVEVDPTWSKYQCVGFRGAVGYPSATLTVEDLCDRDLVVHPMTVQAPSDLTV